MTNLLKAALMVGLLMGVSYSQTDEVTREDIVRDREHALTDREAIDLREDAVVTDRADLTDEERDRVDARRDRLRQRRTDRIRRHRALRDGTRDHDRVVTDEVHETDRTDAVDTRDH